MAKGMNKGNIGKTNKQKLTVQEKKLKKKMKLQTKMAAADVIVPTQPLH